MQNQNQNANKHAGTGNIINTNYNTTTNHYSKADLQETSVRCAGAFSPNH